MGLSYSLHFISPKMQSVVASALVLALWPTAATAGHHRDMIDKRNARYEMVSEPVYSPLEKRSTTYQFMTNSTKRKLANYQLGNPTC